MKKKITIFLTIVGVVVCALSSGAWATMIYGTPVSGVGGSDVGTLIGNEIEYYIPLKASTSGTYDTAGASADSGQGYGYNTAGALTMYLKFTPLDTSISSGVLNFSFRDLDLTPGNTPSNFVESIKISFWDASASSWVQEGSGVIQTWSQFTNNYDVTSYLNPGGTFYTRLNFGSDVTNNQTLTNTPEYLSPTLTMQSGPPVPEPSTMLLLGLGVMGVAAAGRRKRLHTHK